MIVLHPEDITTCNLFVVAVVVVVVIAVVADVVVVVVVVESSAALPYSRLAIIILHSYAKECYARLP